MSIPEDFEIDNRGEVIRHPLIRRYFLFIFVVLIALLSFGLGRLSGESRPSGVSIQYDPALVDGTSSVPVEKPSATAVSQTSAAIQASQAAPSAGQVYASSKGTRYYYLNCKSTVSEKNKVFFNTPAEAEAAGYTLAANCSPK